MAEDADHEYLYTKVEYTHPTRRFRVEERVSLVLQMDYDEIVAGASIDVSSDRERATAHV